MAGAKPAVHVVQLRPISVPEALVKGNKFIKWEDVAVDRCLADLEAYKNGTQLFPTHLEQFEEHVATGSDGRCTFRSTGHVLVRTPTNLTGVKSTFTNAVIANIRSRFPQKDLVDAFFVLGMRGINMGSDEYAKEFGNQEVNLLATHFGEEKSSAIGVPVTLKVDPKGYYLYWRDQNKDMDSLDISMIRDTRTGKQAKVPKEGKLRESCMIGPSDIPLEDKTVTICHGTDMVNVEFVNFVCASRELAVLLCDELLTYANNLLSLNGSALSFLEKAYTKLTHVLDVNGKIPVKNVMKLVTKDNKDDRKRVEQALQATGFKCGKNDTIDPNKFTFEDFFTFYRHLVGRTEVDKVFDEIGAKKKPYLTSDQFVSFLNNQQRDPRLNEILYPYYSSKVAIELIERYETKPNMAAKEKDKSEEGNFSQEGFLKFLMSEDNNLVPPEYLDLNQDMSQPLSHYFINSSHNTYLTGHQLTGKSSVEIYSQVLLSGCRCIELDCWDGRGADEEPMITHGFTMCTEVSFKEVIEAIAASAFKTSDYPVILSFENHCSVRQQAKMAAHCRNIFGDMLLTETLDGFPIDVEVPLPSPELLKHKIIVKNRKKHLHKAKQKVTSPKASKGRSMKANSVDTEEPSEEAKKAEVPAEAPADAPVEVPTGDPSAEDKPAETKVGDDEVYESGSSDSEEDDEVTGLTEEEEKERQRENREKRLQDGEEDSDEGLYYLLQAEKGTAGSEAEAGSEMSALVNYVQPVHFHSFDTSEKKNRCYEISSFVETQATNQLKEYPVEFVNYNKRQLSRVYPRGTRVDSSNFMPQMFWNAGCQLVALNFQTLDLAMQLNLGIFEYNKKSGYILKPDFMRRTDKRFDPFAESTVDGIIAGTVSVKVISGQFLTDKRVGTYVEVDMYGLPTDTHRKKFKTKTVPNNGLNPVYDEQPFVFRKVVLPNLAVIRISVSEETGKLIGHRVLSVEALRPGYRHINLRNECNQPLLLPTLFVHISVKDYVSDLHADFADSLSNPLQYLAEQQRHEKQLESFLMEEEDYKENNVDQTKPFAERRMSNPSPIKPKRNGSLPNVHNGSTNMSLLTRTPSNPHSQIGKKDSIMSSNSSHSDNSGSMHQLRNRLSGGMTVVSRMPSSENVVPTVSIASSTKLYEPSLLQPTPLNELKKEKSYFKVLVKRDKDLEMIRKKNEKARENLKEIHEIQEEKLRAQQAKEKAALEKEQTKRLKKAGKSGTVESIERQNTEEYTRLLAEHELKLKALRKTQAEVFVSMCTEHFQMELDVCAKHLNPLYESLRQVMDQNHRDHEQRLKAIHDQEVKDLTKRMDAQTKEEMRNLQKIHKDKQAFNRLKRENQKKHIDTVVSERQKLKEILDNRVDELKKKLDVIREELEKDKEATHQESSDEFAAKCRQIRDQFKDLIDINLSQPSTSNQPTANGNGNSEDYAIKTQL